MLKNFALLKEKIVSSFWVPYLFPTPLCFIFFLSCQPPANQEGTPKASDLTNLDAVTLEKGAKLFNLQCARCHGIGGGGGNAPSLKRQNLTNALDDARLHSIIQNGIPGTEMPGTWLLTPPDVRLVAGYVRSIGQVKEIPVLGDAAAGKIVYEEKGACQTCHILNGEGGSLGPDLSRIGATRSAEFIQKSLISPGFYKREGKLANSANGFIQYLVYKIKTKAGRELTAIRVNEDAFTIQLRDAGNQFYSLRKLDLLEMTKLYETSLMPSVKNVLTDTDARDLVAYLVSLK